MNVYIDEVGTGSIFGPAIVCALAANGDECYIDGVKDSKQLTKKKRESLFDQLSKFEHSYGAANVKSIEKLNIHYAKYKAMLDAVNRLLERGVQIDKVIVDGSFKIPNLDIPQEAIIKADESIFQCSAASILAKVTRDKMITNIAKIYPGYGLETNAGYYTPQHLEGIVRHGPTPLHRKNFKYFQYALYEHKKYLESGLSADEYIERMKSEKQGRKQTRYINWLETESPGKKYGEIEW